MLDLRTVLLSMACLVLFVSNVVSIRTAKEAQRDVEHSLKIIAEWKAAEEKWEEIADRNHQGWSGCIEILEKRGE